MTVFHQVYNPLGNAFLSTIVAALPILVLLYLLALHPHRDEQGHRHLGISAPVAALFAWVTAFIIAVGILHMPAPSAISAFLYGVLSGFIGIIWIVVAAMFLYTITLITGKFEIVKESITHISFDRRLQVLLIAFSFGAIIEGTSGFGTPVAIAGAMMVGLGFGPFESAILNLIANTAPVAYGAIGTPIITLGLVTGLPADVLSKMAGRQLPFVSILIPFWLVATFVFMEKGSWRDVWEVWPATLVAGGVFAIMQFLVSNVPSLFLLTDIIAGLSSVLAVVLFLRVWHPKTRFLLARERGVATRVGGEGQPQPAAGGSSDPATYVYPYTRWQTFEAWVPWILLIACVAIWGTPQIKAFFDNLIPGVTKVNVAMPYLHQQVVRTPPIAPPNAKPESAIWGFNWLSAAGTGVFVAAILSGLWLRLSGDQWKHAIVRTARRMKIPVLTIAQVLGLGFLTRYSGLDAILGLAFTHVGPLYPFFAALLGWLGVFLAGSDTASNALFGNLQRITAEQLGLNPILITAANSTGGVMGKMIDPQSITVATAACYENPEEGNRMVGPIFRAVVWHSIVLACVMGLIVLLQAYVFPWMIP
jgi:lactate permease